MEAHSAGFLLAFGTALLCIEMVLTRDTGDNLAFSGNPEALLE